VSGQRAGLPQVVADGKSVQKHGKEIQMSVQQARLRVFFLIFAQTTIVPF
jgi:hypothetical protein